MNDQLKTFLFVLMFFVLGGLFLFFAMGAHKKIKDPCYKKIDTGKGLYFEVRDDRVCMQHEEGVSYRYVKTLEGADPETFEEIDAYYFKDKNSVYYGSKKLDANPLKFQELGGDYYRDDVNVFYRGNMLDADHDSFEVLSGGYIFARDKNFVFLRGIKTIVVDAKSFHSLSHDYSKDKDYVYYHGTIELVVLENADSETFEVIDRESTRYARDKNNVYHYDKTIEGADPETFEIVFVNGLATGYARDKSNAYHYGNVIKGADSETFGYYGNGFARDRHYVYHNTEKLKNLDVNDFEQVEDSSYLRDSDSLYYLENEIEGVDVGAFHIITYRKETSPDVFFVSVSECGTDGKVIICHGKPTSGGEIIDPNSK